MEGYIKNKSPIWRHALKRSIGPGEKIPLDELYKAYGLKHDIPEGKPFIDWLREVKLRDRDVWDIMYKDITSTTDAGGVEQPLQTTTTKNQPAPFVKTEMTADDIVGLSVRKLKSELDKINDLKTLKYALSKASQLQDKDTVCKMLRKRIQMLELSRRI